ncbi:hypothetical protein N7448_004201 [Penicillium atrosanguineum]|uniref:Uncharacterized protein n=1 Tax=Penicillium atrosanguineum TaxID=1132637 RepID=A0A9W9H8U5_9EURO|nr:ATP synthase subunit alpha [Penicillium atrosanguineum]KAJ5117263.1 hypothetical protein N7526_011372 [Penicillium atrosanguineum]KAJ5140793.1 hypothetical protein N7448_004201 [Penicillium atrosanguineum]KAJ5310706.1 ATP synthase subunit alpha [Penicillium atrosanguineum]KAJ5316229.1 hypothetical protein N7476_006536 [Penicillium atrosanguineum]
MSQTVPVEQGSIPASVRPHPSGDLSAESIHDEIKGWLEFITEQWTPLPNPEEDLHQRRNLIEKWAAADQSFRDSYDLRASFQTSSPPALQTLPPTLEQRFICSAPVNRETHPTNYTNLLKILIILYLSQSAGGHPFSHAKAGESPNPQFPTFIAADSNLEVAGQDLLAALFLQNADFRMIAISRTGTVLFHNLAHRLWFIIDQSGLDSGRVSLVQFGPNGQAMLAVARRPFNLGEMDIGGDDDKNEPLDMNCKILDILEGIEGRGEFRVAGWGNRETWARDIERCAPGYLELEANGREVEFELESLQELVR